MKSVKSAIAPLVAGCMALFAGITHGQFSLWNSEASPQTQQKDALCINNEIVTVEEDIYFVSCNGFF